VVNDWGGGYCADGAIINTTTSALDWTTSFQIQGTLSGLWGINYTQSGSTVNGEGFTYNNIIQPNDTINFNFCVNR
jgi:cellulase/cellobiase CelA1